MTEPSEAAMQVAERLWQRYLYHGILQVNMPTEIALELDRQTAAQRERDEKIADDLYQYQWRKDEYIYRENVAAAIRSAP